MRRTTSLDDIQAAINRLHSRLYRTVNAIRKLEAAEKRFKAKYAERAKPNPPAKADFDDPVPTLDELLPAIKVRVEDDPLSIPQQFRRSPADEAAAAEIKAEIEAKKAVKTKASAAKSKAKAKGELRRMPLQGKAALDFIKQS